MSTNMQFDDLYTPNTDSFQSQTKPLDQVLRQAIRNTLYETHTCIPVIVTKVLSNSFVDVQPLLYTKFLGQSRAQANQQQQNLPNGQSLQKQPIIQNVPVCHPRGADYWIKLPIAVSDTGIAIFSERSLDNWLAGSGGFTDPSDTRAHHISDAIFIPGLYPTSNVVTGNANDMVLHNGQSELYLQKDGKFRIKNESEELLLLLSELSGAVSDLAGAVSSGFGKLASLLAPLALASEIAAASAAESAAGTIQEDIEGMTGP